MGGLSLGDQQQPPAPRSYIPPHMRGKVGAASNAPPPPMGAGGPPPNMNGLNSSAWAGYVIPHGHDIYIDIYFLCYIPSNLSNENYLFDFY